MIDLIKKIINILDGEVILWIVFSFMFAYFSYSEYCKSKGGLHVKKINVGFPDLNEAFNTVKEAIIISDKQSHSTASISYLLAFLTALGSLILSISK